MIVPSQQAGRKLLTLFLLLMVVQFQQMEREKVTMDITGLAAWYAHPYVYGLC
jgi:hypothetical protein